MLKLALKTLVALLVLIVLFSVAMYVATSPKFSIPATVKDDASLPAIEINGVRLHAEAFGREGAPVVIVLHGGPGNGYKYLLPLQALADSYRVVFYDQRGAGLSQRVPASSLGVNDYVAELDAVVDHYSAGQPVLLIGHSWGGDAGERVSWQTPAEGEGGGAGGAGFPQFRTGRGVLPEDQ